MLRITCDGGDMEGGDDDDDDNVSAERAMHFARHEMRLRQGLQITMIINILLESEECYGLQIRNK